MLISQMEGYFENPQARILEESMLFLLALKETSKKKRVKTKNNLNFAVKPAETSNH